MATGLSSTSLNDQDNDGPQHATRRDGEGE